MSEEIERTSRRRGAPPKGLMPESFDEAPSREAIPRAEMRSPMREESSQERAARRAAQVRGHRGGDMDDGTDEFYISQDMIPDGWTYEWKRKLLLGAEDPSHMVQLLRDGWEPVPLDRDAMHRAMMPSNWKENTIERKGMLLMERPLELSQEVREMNLYRARKQVRDKEAQLAGTPDGTLSRDDPRVRPQIKKGWEAMPVPKE